MLFFGLFVAMLYVATERVGWLVIGVVLATVGIAVTYFLFGHVRVRFDVWLHPFADASGSGYQSVQALYGMADGGILGSGIAQGHPDLVPYANSDFISAALGELLGVTGFMAMLVALRDHRRPRACRSRCRPADPSVGCSRSASPSSWACRSSSSSVGSPTSSPSRG